MKSFIYLGKRFTPVRPFSKQELAAGLNVVGSSTGISNYDNMHNEISSDWDYKEFYIRAKRAGAEKIDIFLMDKKEVVPCTNELFTFKPGPYYQWNQ